MNTELFAFQSQENLQPGSAADESKQASEKMLGETMKASKCDDLSTKCFAPLAPFEQYGKLDRFLMPSEMNIPYTGAATRLLPSGDVISQKGTTQRLSLREGLSIEVNGNGTFAVRDAQGDRIPAGEILIKPTPGNEPRGLTLGFGDDVTANIVDGTMNFRTRSGASIDVDNRGFASISRPESLRLEEKRKKY